MYSNSLLFTMKKDTKKSLADYIFPLNINSLEGRMLKLPSARKKKAEILFIYGHHSNIERWTGLIEVLSDFGNVTVPDLPGFGGMDSFYKLHKKPTIDNYADYLATFIKLRFSNKKITIVGLSFGFVIVTRMLQRHPSITDKVDLLVSIVGFTHKDDFTFSKARVNGYLITTSIFSGYLSSKIFRYLFLNKFILRKIYSKTHNAKHKFKNVTSLDEFDKLINFEIELWHCNDVRTWMYTTIEFLKLDNCSIRINLPVWHVTTKNDNYFDSNIVEQHMQIIFKGFNKSVSNSDNHAPSVILDKKSAQKLVPNKLKIQLNKLK